MNKQGKLSMINDQFSLNDQYFNFQLQTSVGNCFIENSL
jgi:hypothetical protein